jgi:hypothetical protein
VLAALRFGDTQIEIALSEVYDPLPSLLAWLDAIAHNDCPVACTIYDEHRDWRLAAHQFDDDLILVVHEPKSDAVDAVVRVKRRAFLDAFKGAFVALLAQPDHQLPWQPADESQRSYLESLRGHRLFAVSRP